MPELDRDRVNLDPKHWLSCRYRTRLTKKVISGASLVMFSSLHRDMP